MARLTSVRYARLEQRARALLVALGRASWQDDSQSINDAAVALSRAADALHEEARYRGIIERQNARLAAAEGVR